MAIDLSDYHAINKLLKEEIMGLYEHNELPKFYYRFSKDGKRYKRVFDFSDKAWDKKTIHKELSKKIKSVNQDPNFEREQAVKKESTYKKTDTLNQAIEKYFGIKGYVVGQKENGNLIFNTTWNETKYRHYNKYIKSELGKIKIVDIKTSMISSVILNQSKLGLKPRTIKTTIELLNPIFEAYRDDEIIDKVPSKTKTIQDDKNIKRDDTKKITDDPEETTIVFAKAIQSLYANNPFYLSLYLFAMLQRRKSEILKLRWEDIDFEKNTYSYPKTKNGESQTFYLPLFLKNELLKFREYDGWVYKSPLDPNNRLINLEKQTVKVRQKVEEIYLEMFKNEGIENEYELKVKLGKKPKFSLHYFRNIGSSLLQKKGLENYISGAMGHASMQTKNLYATIDYKEHSEKFSNVLEEQILKLESPK